MLIYIISLSLQIAGVACITYAWIKLNLPTIILESEDVYDLNGGGVNSDKCLSKQKSIYVEEKLKEKYINIISFGSIASGYLLGIFAYTPLDIYEKIICSISIVIIVVFMSIAFVTIAKIWAKNKLKNIPEIYDYQ